MKQSIFSQLFLILLLLFSCSHKETGRIVGIKIYEYNGDFNVLTDKWKDMGINTAFVSRSLAADQSFREALRKRDIQIFIIFPVFQNPEQLKCDSTLFAVTGKGLKAKNEWVEFICPSRYIYRKNKIAELDTIIRTLDPDGISIDFIRQFVYWEKIYPGTDPGSIDKACYCDTCLSDFTAGTGIKIPSDLNNTVEKALWLDKYYEKQWDKFRCDLITSMADLIVRHAKKLKPGIKINFHAVPWRTEDFNDAGERVAGQDIREVSRFVDFVSPMCYSQMLLKDAVWISDVVKKTDKKAARKVLPSIQVYPYYTDRSFSTEDFIKCLEEALKPPSRGVVFFSWPLFTRDSSRMEAVKTVLGRISSR